MTSNYWVYIKLPIAVVVHLFIVIGSSNDEGPRAWSFDASKNGTDWTTLYTTDNYGLYKDARYIIQLSNDTPLIRLRLLQNLC